MALLLATAAFLVALYVWRRFRRLEDTLAKRLRALDDELGFLRQRIGADDLGMPAPARPSAVIDTAPPVATTPPSFAPPPPEPLRPSAPLPPEPPPTSLAPQIDWERWLGVRGAAVLGGIFLALAGIFLFRYSIEHNLIPPWLRVVAGLVSGVGCIVASERFLRRQYGGTADAVEGAGVVILYASTWAARVLYELIGTPAAFVAMIAITAACSVLSWRHASLVIALLGLIGGFATPFMLDSGSDNPIGLFAYVFLLDISLLYLARQRRWPLLAQLSLIATTLYQFVWILGQMGPERVTLGLIILALSAALFAVASRGAPDEERRDWMLTQAAGVLLPFGFVIYIGAQTQLAPNLSPLAFLLAVLAAASCWLGAVHRRPWLGLAAASASIAAVGVWASVRDLLPAQTWEVAVAAIVLAVIFHVAVERQREPAGWDGPAPAAILAGLGFFWLLLALSASDSADESALWPWLAAWLVIAALLLRQAEFPGRAWLGLVAAAALAIGLINLAPQVEAATIFVLLLAVGAALQMVALLRRRQDLRTWAEHGAALFAAIALLGLARRGALFAPVGVVTSTGLGLMIALAAARLRRGEWLLAAVLLTAFTQYDWLARAWPPAASATLFALELLAALLFAAFPFAVGRRFAGDRWAWPAAAASGPVWFLLLRRLFLHAYGDAAIGLLAVGLGAVAAAQGWRARSLWDTADARRPRNLVWFFVAAIGFLTVAIPLQLEKSWITIGWALEGLGVLLLWRRFDIAWLKYFGLSLLVAVTVRLIANPTVLGYYPRPSWRIVNWLFYTYLVPAAAMLASAQVLRQLEIGRARGWEASWYGGGRPLGAVVLGFSGMLVVFVWLNLAIADWFSAGPNLEVSLDRMPARDLAMSICWALYALVLLAAGVRLRSVGVRWVSLGLMIITIAKVFLYDLGELRDLYRVASLLGLAISLIAVSLAYQRFVLARAAEEEG